MALPTKSFAEVLRRQLAHSRTSFPGLPLGEKKFLGRNARAVALGVWGIQKGVEDASADIVPNAQSSTDALSVWAALVGLSDGAGGFGRLVATAASGGEATLTGELGVSFTDGDTATAEDGDTQIALSGAVAISGSPPGYGSIAGQFVAVTAGTAGNLPAGTVCTWDNPPAGADFTFTLTSPLAGALDTESNAGTYARIVDRMQNPPGSGRESDYRGWLEDVDGVFRVYVYGRRSGAGTVDVIIAFAGTGQARIPSAAVIAAAQGVIDDMRPITVNTATVSAAYMPNGSGHLVRIRVVPSADRYAFDYADGGSAKLIDTYTAGAPATLKLTNLAQQSLKDAIDAYNADLGDAPRLQVLSTGSVINVPVRAVNWSDGGGKTTLTLETLPDDWTTPTAGDQVYAYGPVVETIASGVLALCDALGPSRVSGYADEKTPWNDLLTISGIIAVAEDAIDTDGTELISEVLVNGATIDGTEADVEGSDGSSNPPELLYLSHVAVTS